MWVAIWNLIWSEIIVSSQKPFWNSAETHMKFGVRYDAGHGYIGSHWGRDRHSGPVAIMCQDDGVAVLWRHARRYGIRSFTISICVIRRECGINEMICEKTLNDSMNQYHTILIFNMYQHVIYHLYSFITCQTTPHGNEQWWHYPLLKDSTHDSWGSLRCSPESGFGEKINTDSSPVGVHHFAGKLLEGLSLPSMPFRATLGVSINDVPPGRWMVKHNGKSWKIPSISVDDLCRDTHGIPWVSHGEWMTESYHLNGWPMGNSLRAPTGEKKSTVHREYDSLLITRTMSMN